MKNLFSFFIILLTVTYSSAQNSDTSVMNRLNPTLTMLSVADGQNEVITALFDIGIDTSVIGKKILWVNPNEVLDNKDNDNDGCIDDIHGVSFLANGIKNNALLPTKGLDSLKYKQLDSLLSCDLTKEKRNYYLAQQKMESFKLKYQTKMPALISEHGTFIAGIIAKGNPKIKIMSLRFDENETSNAYQAKIENHVKPYETAADYGNRQAIEIVKEVHLGVARSFGNVGKYLRTNKVRVVNLSINILTKSEFKQLLSIRPMDSLEKEKIVNLIFETWLSSMQETIGNSPDILFIVTGNNSKKDKQALNRFPNGFNFPNLMSVGGVDNAGNITDFTSLDKQIDVYASGSEIESTISSGMQKKYSSASLATAQITNLASKILAINSNLTPIQLKEIMISNSDKSEHGLLLIDSTRIINFVKNNRK